MAIGYHSYYQICTSAYFLAGFQKGRVNGFWLYPSRVNKHIPKQPRKDGKFGARSKHCMFFGYVHKMTIWRIWNFEGGPYC